MKFSGTLTSGTKTVSSIYGTKIENNKIKLGQYKKTSETVQEIVSFGYTGIQEIWTVPETGVYKFEVWGGQGEQGGSNNGSRGGSGGLGGYAYGELNLNAGETVYINVGNGGGTALGSGNGGGASDIRY